MPTFQRKIAKNSNKQYRNAIFYNKLINNSLKVTKIQALTPFSKTSITHNIACPLKNYLHKQNISKFKF